MTGPTTIADVNGTTNDDEYRGGGECNTIALAMPALPTLVHGAELPIVVAILLHTSAASLHAILMGAAMAAALRMRPRMQPTLI